jgi:hypothetical protein
MEKYFRAGQVTDDNMAHAHCMLDNQGYRHTVIICNMYCFCEAEMVARTQVAVKLYVPCQEFLK